LYYYRSFSPPEWDVSTWNIDTVLVGGTDDEFSTVLDVTNLVSTVDQKKTSLYWMKDWDHYTFCFARDMSGLFEIFENEGL